MNILMKLCLLIMLFTVASLAQTKGWGYNSEGELGIGNKSQWLIPQTIISVPDATAISSGLRHTLFLKADGTVLVAGFNNQNQLGDGTRIEHLTPVSVKNLTNVVQLSGGWKHSVALKSDGTVWSWSFNDSGQIGNDALLDEFFSTPAQTKISDVVEISAGLYHTLALKSDGTVWAWGLNKEGQLGNGTTFDSNTPAQVGIGMSEFSDIISIAAGRYGNLALKADGTVWQWGEFRVKEEGKPSRSAILSTPEQNTSLTKVTEIATRIGNNLALKTDGTILQWSNVLNGRVEYLTMPKDSHATFTTKGCKCFETPTKINIENVIEIKASGLGAGINIVRKSDGSVWGWGGNGLADLGTGVTTKPAPFVVFSPVQSLVGAGNALIEAGFHGGFAAKPSFTTSTGENIFQYGENVTLKFSKVAKSGTTSYTALDPIKIVLSPPKGLRILTTAPAYDINTMAEFIGDIVVCVKVATVYDESEFSRLHLLQIEGKSLTDKTISFNYRKRELCAQTDSLSQFIVAK